MRVKRLAALAVGAVAAGAAFAPEAAKRCVGSDFLLPGRFPLPRKGHGSPRKRSPDAPERPGDSLSMIPARGLE